MSVIRYLELNSSEIVLLEDCVKSQRHSELPWQQFVSEHGSMLLRLGSAMTSSGNVHYMGVTKEECWLLVLVVRSGMAMAGRPIGMELLCKLYKVLVGFECDAESMLCGMNIRLGEVTENGAEIGDQDHHADPDRAEGRASKTPPS